MNSSIAIRFAKLTDSKELSRMNYEFNDVEVEEDEIKNHLRQSDEIVVVAIFDDKTVGFACAQKFDSFCYDKAQCEITEVYVRAEYRRKGVASALVKFIEEELSWGGIGEIKILTGIDNRAALKAYTLAGYTNKRKTVLKKTFSQ